MAANRCQVPVTVTVTTLPPDPPRNAIERVVPSSVFIHTDCNTGPAAIVPDRDCRTRDQSAPVVPAPLSNWTRLAIIPADGPAAKLPVMVGAIPVPELPAGQPAAARFSLLVMMWFLTL